jgi:hypothetical protein
VNIGRDLLGREAVETNEHNGRGNCRKILRSKEQLAIGLSSG